MNETDDHLDDEENGALTRATYSALFLVALLYLPFAACLVGAL